MPLYECHCMGCDLTFEVLAPLREARHKKPCPSCGRPSPRVTSPFAIARAEGLRASAEAPAPAKTANERPACLQYPQLPLLCHMDEKSAKRAVAYAQKRGAEYDDKLATRDYLSKTRGDPPKPEEPKPAHGHTHDFKRHGRTKANAEHSHDHDHGHPHAHDHGGKSHSHAAKHDH